MLSPNDGSRIVLLPEDKELIKLAGWTEAEYREFVRYCKSASRITPGTPVAIGLDVILLQIGIALVLAAVSYALTPKPKTQSRGNAPQFQTTQTQGQDFVSGTRYAPKAGFDSVQNVVEMGSIVPLVYARREQLDGVTYGGIRVNTNLLWSQIKSLGGDQLFRGIFLVGEGDTRADSMELDPEQFALGNNLLGTYDLAINSTSRVSIYYSNDGGRIINSDHIAGRKPATGTANDPGNSSPQPITPDGDVFRVRGAGGVETTDFCYTYKPSNQTSFGLFSWIGNGVCYRTNPSLRSSRTPTARALGNGNFRIVCNDDVQERARREKDQHRFSPKAGITAGAPTLIEGSVVKYELSSAVSFNGNFSATGQGQTANISANDANSAVAARQQSFDESIVVGELYKIGSAIAVCTQRTPAPFASVAEGGNQSVEAFFEVIRPGFMGNPGGVDNTSNTSLTAQIFRLARASFVTEYPCQVLEIGMRSSLGMRVSGLTNTIEANFDYDSIDDDACPLTFPEVATDTQYPSLQRVAGAISTPETRYSCFTIRYREAAGSPTWTETNTVFATRSESSQAIYNFIRFEMPSVARWEFEIEPISSWELRTGGGPTTIEVLDPKVATERNITVNNITIRFNGIQISNSAATFQLRWFQPVENDLRWDGNDMADRWARVSEVLPYNEVTTSVGGNPEHEIVYINSILPNTVVPEYENLSILGINIRASREFAGLSQFSTYINKGLGGFHDFPNVLRDLLTNDRFGVGEVVSPEQIDTAGFTAAKTFTDSRRYFFDGAITEPLNLRQWGTERARDFLLDFIIRNGRFSLQPIVEFDNPEEITGIFTSGNILEDTFELSYFEQDQRQSPRISVRWRQEQVTGAANNRGLFPVVREVTVREQGVSATAPLEQIDMSDFCTSQQHAIDRAKYECRFRRLSTHSVRFTTTTDQAALGLGKCFRLGMETLTFDQPQNGYIAQDGTITSWTEISDGTYTVQAWNGTGTAVTEQQLIVANGKASNLQGYVFCIADNTSRTQTYKVQSLSFNEEGNIEVEAIHWPTNANGYSELVDGWDDTANWILEGEI